MHMNVNNGKNSVLSEMCFLLFGLALTIGLQAQTTIKGKVTDSKGLPVPGASVTIKNSGAGTATGTDGLYQLIANLKAGKYDVVVSSVGFKSAEKTITVTSTAGSFSFDASLKEDATGLDEVVVTGTSQGKQPHWVRILEQHPLNKLQKTVVNSSIS